MTQQLFLITILMLVVIAFGTIILSIVSLLGPSKKNKLKEISYECGIIPEKAKTSRLAVKYFLIAILFIIFDVEIIFLYPWALIFAAESKNVGGLIFAEMMLFTIVLVCGLIYVWKTKGLELEQ